MRETNEEIGVIPTNMEEVAHVYYQPYNVGVRRRMAAACFRGQKTNRKICLR